MAEASVFVHWLPQPPCSFECVVADSVEPLGVLAEVADYVSLDMYDLCLERIEHLRIHDLDDKRVEPELIIE